MASALKDNVSRQIRHRPTKNYDEEEDNKGQGEKGELENQKGGDQGKGRFEIGKGPPCQRTGERAT